MDAESHHTIEFRPSGRGKARCAPDPNHPNGIAVDGSIRGMESCLVELPYPAPECGMWLVRCGRCGVSVAITAAGRPDDPISIRMNCAKAVN